MQQAERVKNVIAKVDGVADLGIVKSSTVLSISITPDRVMLARYGMHLGEFQRVLQTALGGRPVSEFWEGERKFDGVRTRSGPWLASRWWFLSRCF